MLNFVLLPHQIDQLTGIHTELQQVGKVNGYSIDPDMELFIMYNFHTDTFFLELVSMESCQNYSNEMNIYRYQNGFNETVEDFIKSVELITNVSILQKINDLMEYKTATFGKIEAIKSIVEGY